MKKNPVASPPQLEISGRSDDDDECVFAQAVMYLLENSQENTRKITIIFVEWISYISRIYVKWMALTWTEMRRFGRDTSNPNWRRSWTTWSRMQLADRRTSEMCATGKPTEIVRTFNRAEFVQMENVNISAEFHDKSPQLTHFVNKWIQFILPLIFSSHRTPILRMCRMLAYRRRRLPRLPRLPLNSTEWVLSGENICTVHRNPRDTGMLKPPRCYCDT